MTRTNIEPRHRRSFPALRLGRHRGSGVKALTKRERQVLDEYIVYGNQSEVAHALGITLQTVKNHTTAILAKLDVDSSLQAAVLYDRERGRSWPEIERRAGQRRKGERRHG